MFENNKQLLELEINQEMFGLVSVGGGGRCVFRVMAMT